MNPSDRGGPFRANTDQSIDELTVDTDAILAGVYRRHRCHQRRRLVGTGVGVMAVAGLAVAAATAGATDSGGSGSRAEAPDATAEVDLAAEITAATQEAAADSVVHTIQDYTDGSGDSEMWSDESSGVFRTLMYDENGAPSFDHGAANAPAVDAVAPEIPDGATLGDPNLPTTLNRTVDHCFGEYLQAEETAMPARNEGELIGERLANGDLVEDGTEVIDGQELIRLREPEFDEHVYFIEPETYRPVQIHGYVDENGVPMYVQTIEYLPRTPENLALLVTPVPEDFDLVDQLRSDGERFDACGL